MDTRTEYLAEIGARIDCEHDDREHVLVDVDAKQRQAEERNVDLQKERRATYDAGIDGGKDMQDACTGYLHERGDEANGDGQRKADEHETERNEPADGHDGNRGDDEFGLEEEAQEGDRVPSLDSRLLSEPVGELFRRRRMRYFDGRRWREVKRLTVGQSVRSRQDDLPVHVGKRDFVHLETQTQAGGERLGKAHVNRRIALVHNGGVLGIQASRAIENGNLDRRLVRYRGPFR